MRTRIAKQARRGFTLIELMIVIAIIGVLAAIAVPNFRAARNRANLRACMANQKTLSGAIEMYNLDRNTKMEDLGKVINDLKTGGYIQSIPSDPGSGAAPGVNYTYKEGIVVCSVHGTIEKPTDPNGGGGTANPPPAAQ